MRMSARPPCLLSAAMRSWSVTLGALCSSLKNPARAASSILSGPVPSPSSGGQHTRRRCCEYCVCTISRSISSPQQIPYRAAEKSLHVRQTSPKNCPAAASNSFSPTNLSYITAGSRSAACSCTPSGRSGRTSSGTSTPSSQTAKSIRYSPWTYDSAA